MKKISAIWLFASLFSFNSSAQLQYDLHRIIGQTTDRAFGMATDSKENIYFADILNACVQKYDSAGNFLLKFGTYGSGNGQFYAPYDIAIDENDFLFVVDSDGKTVQKFTETGVFVSRWYYGPNYNTTVPGLIYGAPFAITESNGFFYLNVLNWNRSMEIYKFTNDGVFQANWSTQLNPTNVFISTIQADKQGNICVAIGDSLIRKYAPDGSIVSQWGIRGAGQGQFSQVTGIDFDSNNNCYVTENIHPTGMIRFQVFDPSGTYIAGGEYPNLEYNQYNQSYSNIEVSLAGYVYINNPYGNGTIRVFTLRGILPPFTTSLVGSLDTEAFNLFPNPSSSETYLFVSEQNQIVNILVYDATGSIVYVNEQAPSNTNVALPEFAPGMYAVRVTGPKGTTTKKLIKL